MTQAERTARMWERRLVDKVDLAARIRAKVEAEFAALKAENTTLGTERIALRRQLANEQKLRKAAEAKLVKPAKPPPTTDERIAQLEAKVARYAQTNRELRNAMKYREKEHAASLLKKGKMPQSTYAAVVKCLHPDQRANATEEQINEACGLFTEWKKAQDRSYSGHPI